MPARVGLFDSEARRRTWFDDEALSEGWYDADIIPLSVADSTPPTTTFVSQTQNKISGVAGWNSVDVQFQANEAFVEYQARIVPSAGSDRTQGTLIEQASVSVAADERITITITRAELAAASAIEGSNLIKLFTKDAAGNWST